SSASAVAISRTSSTATAWTCARTERCSTSRSRSSSAPSPRPTSSTRGASGRSRRRRSCRGACRSRIRRFGCPPPPPRPPARRGTMRAGVERGFHLMTGTGSTVEELEQRNQYINYLFQEMGRSPDGIERHATRFVFCSTNQSDINDAIDETIWQIRTATALNHGKNKVVAGRNLAEPEPSPGEPSREVWQQRLIFGNPDECIRRLQAHANAGITYVFALFDFGGLDHKRAFESMKLFTREVMPAVPEIVMDP